MLFVLEAVLPFSTLTALCAQCGRLCDLHANTSTNKYTHTHRHTHTGALNVAVLRSASLASCQGDTPLQG